MENKRKVGAQYEQRAVEYLEQLNYRILECNYHAKTGEIDIVAKEEQYLVFVEVKYRSSTKIGFPEEAVDYRKKKHIVRTAKAYLTRFQLSEFTPCRFDVIVILDDKVKLIKNAFEAV